MKHCPQCDRYYRDDTEQCPQDGATLEEVDPIFTFLPYESARLERESRKAKHRKSLSSSDIDAREFFAPARAEREQAPGTYSPETNNPPEAHFHGVDEPVPPHDDWEAWGARLPSTGSRAVDPVWPTAVRADDGRSHRRSDWLEMIAAAFGFAMLGFLLHVISTPHAKRPSTAVQVSSTDVGTAISPPIATAPGVVSRLHSAPARTVEAIAPRVASTAVSPAERAKTSYASPAGARRIISRSLPVGTALEAAALSVIRPVTVVQIPATRVVSIRHINESAVVSRTRSVAPSRPVLHARPAPVRLARGGAKPADRTVRRPEIPARVRIAGYRGEAHVTPAHSQRLAAMPNHGGSVLPAMARASGRPVDPDEEVITLSAAIDRRQQSRDSVETPHGPFGLSYPQGERHVVYVVDASSTMGARWNAAVGEIARSIQTLGPDDTFDVVTYSRRARAFSSTLMPVMPGTVSSVIDYLRYVRVGGGADLQQALWIAMDLPQVNDVIVVTGGMPTLGETDLKRLAGFTAAENRNRVRIDTVALVDRSGAGRDSEELLGEIARDNGGRSRAVSID